MLIQTAWRRAGNSLRQAAKSGVRRIVKLPIRRIEMERIPRGLYTPEFRLEAVKLVEETGMSIVQAAKQLSVPQEQFA